MHGPGRRNFGFSRALVLASALLALPAPAWASAQELFGVGPRDIGMAGAATALGDQYGAPYYDPAGMSDAPRLRLSANYVGAESHLSIDGKAARGAIPLHAQSIGMVLPLPLKGFMADRLALGVVVHAPNERLIRVYSRPPDEPQFVLLQNHAQVLGLFVGGSARISQSFALGFGARLAANVRARVSLDGDETGTETTSNGFLSNTATPIVAVRWAPPQGNWRAALVYRHRFRQVFATPAVNELSGLRTPTPGIKATTLFVPSQIALGVAWEPKKHAHGKGDYEPWELRPGWATTLDVTYKRWSEFPDPTVVLGKLPVSTAPFPTFHDTVAIRTGTERRITLKGTAGMLALRGGLGYEPSPAPEMQDDYNFFDNDRAIVATGLGYSHRWRAKGHMSVDAGFQVHLLAPRTHVKDPAKVSPGADLRHETDGHVRVGTVGVTWAY